MAKGAWDAVKAAEKAEKAARRAAAGHAAPASHGLLDVVPGTLPALARAVKLQREAGKVGFDWNDWRAVVAKIREELGEVESSMTEGQARREEEIGDLLFAMSNLARHLDIEPDAALRGANEKFLRRFRYIEAALALEGSSPGRSTLARMDALWNEAKALEKGSQSAPAG